MLTIGIDIGGTNIKTGLIGDGKVIGKKTIEALSQNGLHPQLKRIEETIRILLAENDADISLLSGIGISIPGIVNSKTKKVLVINDKFNDVIGMDLEQWAYSVFGKPLAMDNDARCALIGEWQYGAGQGCENLVMVTLGTGLGTSALIDGKILRGSHNIAGILGGHFIIDRHGLMCNCGNRGCAEAQASSWNLEEIVKSKGVRYVQDMDFKAIFEQAETGNPDAITIRNHCMDVWLEAIVNLIYAYDPEKVIMAGGIMKSADTIIPYIKDKIVGYGWAPFDKIDIVCSEVFADAAILSAEYLIKNI